MSGGVVVIIPWFVGAKLALRVILEVPECSVGQIMHRFEGRIGKTRP